MLHLHLSEFTPGPRVLLGPAWCMNTSKNGTKNLIWSAAYSFTSFGLFGHCGRHYEGSPRARYFGGWSLTSRGPYSGRSRGCVERSAPDALQAMAGSSIAPADHRTILFRSSKSTLASKHGQNLISQICRDFFCTSTSGRITPNMHSRACGKGCESGVGRRNGTHSTHAWWRPAPKLHSSPRHDGAILLKVAARDSGSIRVEHELNWDLAKTLQVHSLHPLASTVPSFTEGFGGLSKKWWVLEARISHNEGFFSPLLSYLPCPPERPSQ